MYIMTIVELLKNGKIRVLTRRNTEEELLEIKESYEIMGRRKDVRSYAIDIQEDCGVVNEFYIEEV